MHRRRCSSRQSKRVLLESEAQWVRYQPRKKPQKGCAKTPITYRTAPIVTTFNCQYTLICRLFSAAEARFPHAVGLRFDHFHCRNTPPLITQIFLPCDLLPSF